MFDCSAAAAGTALRLTTQRARLMVGVPDYESYVAHRRTNHPGQPIMSYKEFFRERQQARYAVGKAPSAAAAELVSCADLFCAFFCAPHVAS
jgi:uncharacterized short protein YbdD (DUF466 family)